MARHIGAPISQRAPCDLQACLNQNYSLATPDAILADVIGIGAEMSLCGAKPRIFKKDEKRLDNSIGGD